MIPGPLSAHPSPPRADVTGSAGLHPPPSPARAAQTKALICKELCIVHFGTFQLIPPFLPGLHSLALVLGAGEGRSALISSPGPPTAWPLPCSAPGPSPSFFSPNLAAEEVETPHLHPKTSSGTLCLKICFLFLLLRKGLLKKKNGMFLTAFLWFLFPKPSFFS